MLVMGHRQPAISFGITIYTTRGSSRKVFPFFFLSTMKISRSPATIINIRMRPEYPSNLGNIIFPYFLLFMVCSYLLINLPSPFRLFFLEKSCVRSFINPRSREKKKISTQFFVEELPPFDFSRIIGSSNPSLRTLSGTLTRRRVITLVGRYYFLVA